MKEMKLRKLAKLARKTFPVSLAAAGLLCGLLLSGSKSVSVRAQGLVSARVTSVSGRVEIQRASTAQVQFVKISLSDELRPGDVVRTGRSSRLVLELSDGSLAVFGDNTTAQVSDFNASPKKLFEILRGKTRVHIEHAGGKPNPYQVTTPTAVIAVRGTTFDVEVRGNTTDVFVHEGRVEVFSLRHLTEPVMVQPFERVRIQGDDLPSSPRRFRRGENDDDFMDPREVGQDPLRDRFESFERESRDEHSGRSGDRDEHSSSSKRENNSSHSKVRKP